MKEGATGARSIAAADASAICPSWLDALAMRAAGNNKRERRQSRDNAAESADKIREHAPDHGFKAVGNLFHCSSCLFNGEQLPGAQHVHVPIPVPFAAGLVQAAAQTA